MDTDTENIVKTGVAIDSTGEVATYDINPERLPDSKIVTLHIEGTASADYAVDVGAKDADGNMHWFDDEITYTSVTDVDDAWQQAEAYLRIRVTTAATSGATAKILVASAW